MRNIANPKSISHAYITATRPTSTAPVQRIPYCSQRRRTRRKVWPCRPASIRIIGSVPDHRPASPAADGFKIRQNSSKFVHVLLALHDLRNQLAIESRSEQFDEGINIAAQISALLQRHAR